MTDLYQKPASHECRVTPWHYPIRRRLLFPILTLTVTILSQSAFGQALDNYAPSGTAILGTKESLEGGIETEVPHANAGGPENINDEDLTTRVDTYNGDQPGTVSYVGIIWSEPIATPVGRLELTLATFTDGGWFGVNGQGPGAGSALGTNHLVEPLVEISRDGGQTWTNAAHTSDYIPWMTGHGIGGGANPNPSPVTAQFTLTEPVTGITGIRLIGTEGGTGSAGFLGVLDLAVRPPAGDTDNDGIDDVWERAHGLNVGTNDASADSDGDGATNLQEYTAKSDPAVTDTDADGLTDGAELNDAKSNPLRVDSDADGLSDNDEFTTHKTNPNSKDSDGDGYADAVEVGSGSDPNSAASIPNNLAASGTGILGTKPDMETGPETAVFNAGNAQAINDGNETTRVDTYNGGGTDTVSFVGVLWNAPLTNSVIKVDLTLAVFFDGGWFGVAGAGPGTGGLLNAAEYLTEPTVQVTRDHGVTWTNVAHTSDYLTALEGHALPDVAFGPPTLGTATFTLTTPQTGIDGIRVIGTEGGTASGGFLGVFDFSVQSDSTQLPPTGITIKNVGVANNQFRFEFDSKSGTTHTVQYKNAVTDATWQTLTTVTGDGTAKEVTDALTDSMRIYRISNP